MIVDTSDCRYWNLKPQTICWKRIVVLNGLNSICGGKGTIDVSGQKPASKLRMERDKTGIIRRGGVVREGAASDWYSVEG